MRIIVKILLSIAVIIVALVFASILFQTGNSNTGFIRLLPGVIIIIGLIGVWTYKPNKQSNSDKTDLNKNL